MEKYMEEYEQFWKHIVENEDGTLNKDQVARELSDFSTVIKNCTLAYSLMSNGHISKPYTHFYHVENIFNETYLYKGIIRDDIREILKMCTDYDELVEELKDYFYLTEDK